MAKVYRKIVQCFVNTIQLVAAATSGNARL
jgi:hypothetical protein